jgi:GNAT superfamily N-acetyltransferase
MPRYRHLAFERGALWAIDLRVAGPSLTPRIAVTFAEIDPEDTAAIARAMGLASVAEPQRRFVAGSRCFAGILDGAIVAYSWLSRGQEHIGEWEHSVRLRSDEAYIWDCATLARYRGKGVYSALLSYVITTLRREGVRRAWIGVALHNRASRKGFARAGFRPAIGVFYIRALRFSHIWLSAPHGAPASLVSDARWTIGVTSHARAEFQESARAQEIDERGSLPHGGTV